MKKLAVELGLCVPTAGMFVKRLDGNTTRRLADAINFAELASASRSPNLNRNLANTLSPSKRTSRPDSKSRFSLSQWWVYVISPANASILCAVSHPPLVSNCVIRNEPHNSCTLRIFLVSQMFHHRQQLRDFLSHFGMHKQQFLQMT